jgi:hypothetical protein
VDLAAHAAVDGSPDALQGLTVYARREDWLLFSIAKMGLRYDPASGNFRCRVTDQLYVIH